MRQARLYPVLQAQWAGPSRGGQGRRESSGLHPVDLSRQVSSFARHSGDRRERQIRTLGSLIGPMSNFSAGSRASSWPFLNRFPLDQSCCLFRLCLDGPILRVRFLSQDTNQFASCELPFALQLFPETRPLRHQLKNLDLSPDCRDAVDVKSPTASDSIPDPHRLPQPVPWPMPLIIGELSLPLEGSCAPKSCILLSRFGLQCKQIEADTSKLTGRPLSEAMERRHERVLREATQKSANPSYPFQGRDTPRPGPPRSGPPSGNAGRACRLAPSQIHSARCPSHERVRRTRKKR